SELISIVSSLWSTGVMSFLGGFLLTSISGLMNLWISPPIEIDVTRTNPGFATIKVGSKTLKKQSEHLR
ncbi:hypothetical protein L9F63_025179, partial [Diploptera punctata]